MSKVSHRLKSKLTFFNPGKRNQHTRAMRVLLLDYEVNYDEHQSGFAQYPLDYLEKTINSICDKLVWLKLPQSTNTLLLMPTLKQLKPSNTLRVLECNNIGVVGDVTVHASKTLQYLNMSGNVGLDKLSFRNLPCLRWLNMTGCCKLTQLSQVETLQTLSVLNLQGCSMLESDLDLTDLSELRTLDLASCEQLTTVYGLNKLPELKHLDIHRCFEFRYGAVTGMMSLLHLKLSIYGHLTASKQNGGLQQLTNLEIWHCADNDSKTLDISMISALERLDVSYCNNFTTITGLDTLAQLKELYLNDSSGFRQLPDIAATSKLKVLSLAGCASLSSMTNQMKEFTALERLDVRECGIGTVIIENPEIAQQVDDLLNRPGFKFTNVTGGSSNNLQVNIVAYIQRL
jgi:Leucine-rich repeat (LRR) protein